MAFTWENSGSYQDLSDIPLAKTSMWPTSQAAGNMTSSSENAMTAPGSDPVDPLPDRDEQGDPAVKLGAAIKPGTDGKPQARTTDRAPGYSPPAWKRTGRPETVRET